MKRVLRWPRGRYNGLRIVGVRSTWVLDVTDWGLHCGDRFGRCAQVGPVKLWLSWEFECDITPAGQAQPKI